MKNVPVVKVVPASNGIGSCWAVIHKGKLLEFAYTWAFNPKDRYWWKCLYAMAEIDEIHPPRRKHESRRT